MMNFSITNVVAQIQAYQVVSKCIFRKIASKLCEVLCVTLHGFQIHAKTSFQNQ